MDFEISDEQELLRNGLRELLDRACDVGHVRSIAYNGGAPDAGLWQEIADAGWTAVAVPEADGGAGLRFEDVALVVEEAGRALLPLPLTTTLLASRAIARTPASAARSDLLSRITDGSTSVTLALRSGVNANGCRAERGGDGWRLSGTQTFVPYGPQAGVVLVDAPLPDGSRGLFALATDAGGVAWTDLDVMDRTTPQFELSLDGATIADEASLFDGDATVEIERLTDEWRAALAAESLGVAGRLVELTVAYAKERVQFGRAIGTNQAVKARIAEMGAAAERMRAGVYHAAVKIDAEADDRVLAVAMAKAATAEPGAFVGSQAIHVHGGVSYTWEHDLHLYFKRIKSNELLLGDAMASYERVANAVL